MESLADRLNIKLHRLFLAAMIAWVVLMGFRPMMDSVDLGWHVAQGRWMVQHGAFYRHDLFNYPTHGHALVDEYPLFQLILYAAWTLGWWGPCALTALAYALLVGLFFHAARELRLATSALLCLAVVLMFLYMQIVFPLRPHLFTYLGMSIFGVFLLKHRAATDWKTFWPLAVMQVAWTNGHSGFIVGPAMVAMFGTEMTLRQAIAVRTIPWRSAAMWFCVFLLTLLACFVNPYGIARFYPPIFQGSLESIRAYVGEMQPLSGGLGAIFHFVTIVALLVVLAALITRRGATSYSFLLLTITFYFQAQTVEKAWPIFGLFLPLMVLSGAAFSPTVVVPSRVGSWLGVAGQFLVLVFAGMALTVLLNPAWPTSIAAQWQQQKMGRSELSLDAVAWMKAHGVEGRLFDRCEDGGFLQQEGFDHGETFGDTGFGKYDEAFIHEAGLVNERPATIPRFLAAYRPDFVVCSTFCFPWPYYLKRNGWRLIFYSPNSSVWTRADLRPDLPTVTNEEIMATFDRELAVNGFPANVALFGRSVIALNSLGLEDFAFEKLTGRPKEDHAAGWYWEAARILCFAEPRMSAAHRDTFFQEAEELARKNAGAQSEFRAYYKMETGDEEGAFKILQGIPPGQLGNFTAELLLQIELKRKMPEALALARRTDCFDLRNGRHWMYLAEAEERYGSVPAAGRAWLKAVFYYPDDAELMQAASDFASRNRDPALASAIAESTKIYGSNP